MSALIIYWNLLMKKHLIQKEIQIKNKQLQGFPITAFVLYIYQPSLTISIEQLPVPYL